MSSTETLPNGVEKEFPFRPRQSIAFNTSNSVTITDVLYGTITITDPVIIALIQDDSFQRLKGIHQHGITPVINVNKVHPPVCRFEHSVGAMLLVRTLAPDDHGQQYAALLHDISHTVLSHVTDYAFGYVIHEVEKDDYVATTSIPSILAKFHYNWKDIMNEELWPLLEQPAPLLCADRLDYGLRDMVAFGVLSTAKVRAIVEQFVVHESRIMCSDVNLARDLARGYMRCDVLAWANPHHSGLYRFAGDAIRLAIAHGVIRKEELWVGTDAQFWDKILNCGIKEIDEKTQYVNEYTKFTMVSSLKEGELVVELTLKIRTIDPEVLAYDGNKSKVHRLSELDKEFAKDRQDYIDRRSKPIYLAIS